MCACFQTCMHVGRLARMLQICQCHTKAERRMVPPYVQSAFAPCAGMRYSRQPARHGCIRSWSMPHRTSDLMFRLLMLAMRTVKLSARMSPLALHESSAACRTGVCVCVRACVWVCVCVCESVPVCVAIGRTIVMHRKDWGNWDEQAAASVDGLACLLLPCAS